MDRRLLGWEVTAEAAPSDTGLPLWTAVRRWRPTRASALRVAPKAERKVREAVPFWLEDVAQRQARRVELKSES